MTSYLYLWLRKKRLELIEKFSGKCCECGATTDLEFAHISDTPLSGKSGRGSKERYYDVLYHPEAYKLMDKSCHRRFDAEMRKWSFKGGKR